VLTDVHLGSTCADFTGGSVVRNILVCAAAAQGLSSSASYISPSSKTFRRTRTRTRRRRRLRGATDVAVAAARAARRRGATSRPTTIVTSATTV
jgi:hypothetical protein